MQKKVPWQSSKPNKWLVIFCLVMAGEVIFGLPFHIVRYFRPTFLEVFNLTNSQLGDSMAIYGITAMLSYFPGGVLADRFSARNLMSLSLVTTGFGGLYLLFIPGETGLSLVFGFWGVTTILLFWSAMIRATREWGGQLAQGRAFGILDGGRGLIAAVMSTLAVLILSTVLTHDVENISPHERAQALKAIIFFYTFMAFGTAVLIRAFIPNTRIEQHKTSSLRGVMTVLKNRSAWFQAAIVVAAYCGYRGLDFYSLYGIDILGMNEVSSAHFVSNAAYLRVIGAIGAGFLADRFTTKKVISATFILLSISYLALMILVPDAGSRIIIFANLVFTFLAVYALRGVYFALFEEMKVSGNITGTTVGLVSVIGFTPDIFFNSIAGRILDASPGLQGYHNFFLFLGFASLIGLLATFTLSRSRKTTAKT